MTKKILFVGALICAGSLTAMALGRARASAIINEFDFESSIDPQLKVEVTDFKFDENKNGKDRFKVSWKVEPKVEVEKVTIEAEVSDAASQKKTVTKEIIFHRGDTQHQEATVEIEPFDNPSVARSSNLKFKVIVTITLTQDAINRGGGDIRQGLTVVGKKTGTAVVNSPQTVPRELKSGAAL